MPDDLAHLAPATILRGKAATRAALEQALAQTAPGTAGLVVYAGHAATLRSGSACLVLAAEGPRTFYFSAHDLLASTPEAPDYRYLRCF